MCDSNLTVETENYYKNDEYEKWLIKSLPDEWEVDAKPSEVIRQLKERLREAHENCLKELSSELADVNTRIENDLRLKSDKIKQDLQDLKKYGLDSLPAINEDDDIFQYDVSVFKQAKKLCMELLAKGEDVIDIFYDYLKVLEKDRSEDIKKILGVYYKKVQAISHKAPYEIQMLFENEILHTNQIILNNLKNYADLHQEMNNKYTNDIKLMIYKIDATKEQWKNMYKEKIFELLKNFEIRTDDIEEIVNKSKRASELLDIFGLKRQELKAKLAAKLPRDAKEVDKWYNCVVNLCNEFRSHSQQLIDLYKDAVEKIILQCQVNSDISVSTLVNSDMASDLELQNFNSMVLEPQIIFMRKSVVREFSHLEITWNKVLEKMLMNIGYMNEVLKVYVEMLDKHSERIKELQGLVMLDLNQNIETNDKLMKSQEVALNVAVDTIRQEMNEKKATKLMKKIEKILNTIQNTMSKNHDIELKVIMKYNDFVESESDLFKSELNVFLRKYSPKHQQETQSLEDTSNFTGLDFENSLENNSKVLPNKIYNNDDTITSAISKSDTKQVKPIYENGKLDDSQSVEISRSEEEGKDYSLFEIRDSNLINFDSMSLVFGHFQKFKHFTSLNKWNEIFCESIGQYLEYCTQEQLEQAEVWTSVQIQTIDERYQNLTEIHGDRYQRIKAEVLDVRLAEIRKHQDRFESHKLGIDKAFEEIDESIINFNKQQNTKVGEIFNKMDYICKTNKAARGALQANANLEEARRILDRETNNRTKDFTTFYEATVKKTDTILRSNYCFLKSLKLFSEGGNFSGKELTTFGKKLAQLDKIILKKTATIKSQLNNMDKKTKELFNKEPKKYFAALNDSMEIGHFNDDAINVVVKLQKCIKDEATHMKQEARKMCLRYEEIRELAKENLEFEPIRTQYIINYMKDMMQYVQNYAKYLQENDPPLRLSVNKENVSEVGDEEQKKEKGKKENGNKTDKNNKGKEIAKGKKGKKKEQVFENYKQNFFASPNDSVHQNIPQFMPIVCKNIYDSLNDVQTKATEFYANIISIPEEMTHVHKTYDEFMKEVVGKYKNYYLQGGQVWLEHIKDFICFVNEYQQFTRELCKQYLITYHQRQIGLMKTSHEANVTETKSIMDKNVQLLKDIHDQLKPLHGYPMNKHLLQNLDEKLKCAIASCLKNFSTLIHEKLAIKGKYKENYEVILFQVIDDIENLKSIVWAEDFWTILIEQAEAYLLSLDELNTLSKSQDEKYDINRVISLFKKIANIPEDQRLSNIVTTKAIDTGCEIKLPVSRPSTQSCSDDADSTTLMEIFKNQLEQYMTEFTHLKNIHDEFVENLRLLWQMDVQNVVRLYTVKYE